MTASYHRLGSGRDAGLYYVNDPNREARPQNRDEYYLADGGGIWWSNGETIVRHGAAIDKASFRDLCAGIDPGTGRDLVRGAGEKHRAGWDITFSAPKALSLLWASGMPAQRGDLEVLHGEAIDAALRFIERQQLLEVRLGAGGVRREQPTDIIVGRFLHTTSRAGDPQLHTHCVFMNVAGCADGKWRTLEPDALYKWQMTVGAAYRSELSRLLVERGFALRPAGTDQIEIAGVDEDLIETFAKRSREIEAVVGDRRTASGAQKEIAALATRQSKEQLPTGADLEARWHREFGDALDAVWTNALEAARPERSLSRGSAASLPRTQKAAAPEDANQGQGGDLRLDPIPVAGNGPVATAASKLLSHESVISRKDVLRRSLIEASRRGIGIAAVEAELTSLQSDRSLVTLREGRNGAWTTEQLIRAEATIRAAARRGDERSYFRPDAVADALAAAPHLSDEQRAAVEGVASRDGVSMLEAGAGTGKTTLASALQDAAVRSGLKVIGLAPTWIAADELAKSIGIPAQAVAKWRFAREQQPSGTRAAGRAASTLRIDAETVILLDEAGMLGTLDMAAVLSAAKAAGAKVVAFGDRRQLASVAPGSALSLLAEELRIVETLKIVRRQENEWQRTASIQMGEGRFAEALEAYHRHGAVRFAEGSEQAITDTIEAWRDLRERHGDDVLIVTRSNHSAIALNRAARQMLREEGALTTEGGLLPSVDRKNKLVQLALSVGDHVRFGANLKDLGIRYGTRGRVVAIDAPSGGLEPVLTIWLEDGRQIESVWADLAPPQRGRAARPLPRITHAYAGTSYSVQGRTADAAVFHVGDGTDARETYVAMTRHRKEARLVVDGARLMRNADFGDEQQDVNVEAKLAALTAEASRFEEKLNVATFQREPVERLRRPAPTRDNSLSL